MCWSFEVSLTFTILEFIGCAYLFHRNLYLDRMVFFIQLPVAVQEFAQALIWKLGDPMNATASSCKATNQSLSIVWNIFVYIIPLSNAILYYKAQCLSQGSFRHRHAQFSFYLQLFNYPFTLLYLLVVAPIWYDIKCTTVGDTGHLINTAPGLPWNVSSAAISIMYFYPVLVVFVLYRPFWLMALPFGGSLLSAVLMNIYIGWGGGWGTIWCWSAGFVLLYWIALPYVVNFVIGTMFGGKVDAMENYFSFRGTHQHLKQFWPTNAYVTEKEFPVYGTMPSV